MPSDFAALKRYAAMPLESVGLECLDYVFLCMRRSTGGIDILDAQEPLAAVCFGLQVARSRREQGPEMQRTGRRRGKTTDVAHGLFIRHGKCTVLRYK